jgi:hypothetical protein
MKITIELNGVKVQKDIPVTWDQVNYDQFLNLAQAGNDVAKILSVFTGIEAETIRKAKIHNFQAVYNLISFVWNTQLDTSRIPDTILGYKIPKKLEVETIAQFEDLKIEAGTIKDGSRESLMAYCRMIAIYVTNPYDSDKADQLAPYFLNASCQEVVALGNFTLMKLMPLKSVGLRSFLRTNSMLTRSRLVMKGWLSRLAFTVRYYFLSRKLHLPGKNY